MAVSPFPVTLAELTGLFMESVLFGIFLCSFVTVLIFWHKNINTFSDRLVLAVVLIMGFIAIWDISLLFKNNVDAFVFSDSPSKVFGNISHWLNVTRGTLYGVQTLLGDSILIFRCYKIYFDRFIIIAFPIVIWFGLLTCVIAAAFIEAHLGESTLTAKELSPFGTGFVSLTLSLNIIVTSMIAWRIWTTYSESNKFLQSNSTSSSAASMKRVMLTIIESGAIYSTALLILLGVYVSKNEANVPLSDAMVQIIPIVFNVILIRVQQGRTRGSTIGGSSSNTNGTRTGGASKMTVVFAPNSSHGSSSRVTDPNFSHAVGEDSYTLDDMSKHAHIRTVDESPV